MKSLEQNESFLDRLIRIKREKELEAEEVARFNEEANKPQELNLC